MGINVSGKNVVVTGVIAGESRVTAENRLRAAGAKVASSVTKTTDLLICGAKVGASKTTKAQSLGAQIVSWDDVSWDGGGDGEAAAPAAAPGKLLPIQVGPMLAKKEEHVPTGDGWLHEIKWDGYRCVATVKGGRVAMQSRSGLTDYVDQFPAIARDLATLPDCIVDGEIVVLDREGGSFAAVSRSSAAGQFIAFDLLALDGDDLRRQPLGARRDRLDILINDRETPLTHVGISPDFADGEQLLAYCVENGLEGVVSKRIDSTYKEGARDGSWIKVKCRLDQEFVVVGYTEGEGQRAATFGALVLAAHDDDGNLVLTGKANVAEPVEHAALFAALRALPVGEAPPGASPEQARKAANEGTTWVAPEIVVQVEFQKWTDDGRLWHPSYKGQRRDKPAAQVTLDR